MKLSKHMICLFLTVFLVPVSSSWSFEKKAHSEMSEAAVAIFTQLYPEKALEIKDLTAHFIEGSVIEDDVNIFAQRLVHWHFYDPGKRLGRAWWGAYKSNAKRFGNLTDKLGETKKDNLPAIYKLVGRLAHHIQDMSSPPHTVPIYHTTKDPFDKYATHKIKDFSLSSAQLISVKNEKPKTLTGILPELRQEAANKTIAQVGEAVVYNGNEIAADWSEFWRSYEQVGAECGGKKPSKNFGCYGNNVFGEQTGSFTPEVYGWFYKKQVTGAIQDTLRLLIVLSE